MKNGGKSSKPKILAVVDEEENVLSLGTIIDNLGYSVILATSLNMAIDLLQEEGLPQLVMIDLGMVDKSGYELIYLLKENQYTKDIPIIIITNRNLPSEKVRGFKAGAVDYITVPFDVEEIKVRLETHLRVFKMQNELEMSNKRLNLMIQHQMKRIEEEQRNILYALARITEFTDAEEGYSHLSNVSYNSKLLAESLSLTDEYEKIVTSEFVDTIETAALLHDIGKISIPTWILKKPGKLNSEEKEIVKEHTLQGARIIQEIQNSCEGNRFLEMAEKIARCHHEKWDGTGYPVGLREKEIPLEARIISVIGIYDILVNEQIYRKKYTKEEALKIMNEESGKTFDPFIYQVFCKIVKQLH